MPSPRPIDLALTALLALGPLSCGKPSLLEELAPEQNCRRTVLAGPPPHRPPAPPPDTASSDGGEAGPGGRPTPVPVPVGPAADPVEDTALAAEAARRARLEVDWRLPEEVEQLHRLNAWCAAVGAAVVGGWAPAASDTAVDTLVVVSWNAHVGGGQLRELVADLRAGRLTGGRPVQHFVLLLQEVYREGETVPEYDPGLPGGSGVDAGPVGRPREDIVRDAEALGLSLLYVPSMRSGRAEDRGNAILSTFPLADPVAIPLPVARQRRVAVAATVAGRNGEGRSWQVQLVSAHLENEAEGFVRNEAARLRQGEALLDAVPEAAAAVVGGDFNTWSRADSEAVVRAMLRAYPDTPPFPTGPTYRRAWGLVRRYLDYIFFRLPDGASASYRRVPRLYNSDHYPLVGLITLGDR